MTTNNTCGIMTSSSLHTSALVRLSSSTTAKSSPVCPASHRLRSSTSMPSASTVRPASHRLRSSECMTSASTALHFVRPASHQLRNSEHVTSARNALHKVSCMTSKPGVAPFPPQPCRLRGTRPNRSVTCAKGKSDGFPIPDEEERKELYTKFRNVKWDSLPRNWDTFWNMKIAGTVVEADVDDGTVEAANIRRIDLKKPEDREDLIERLKCNIIFYRQNYAAIFYGFTLFSSLFASWLVTLALLAAAGAAAAASNTLLGQITLTLDEKYGAGNHPVVWNETRVGGFNRKHVTTGLLWAAALCVCLDVVMRGPLGAVFLVFLVVRCAVWSLVAALAHASFRPVDLSSLGKSVIDDLKAATSSGDLTKRVGKAFKSAVKLGKSAIDSAAEEPAPFTWFRVKSKRPPADGPAGPAAPPPGQGPNRSGPGRPGKDPPRQLPPSSR